MFRSRLTTQDITQLLVYSAFPVHIWTIVNTLRDVPLWILYLSPWNLTGAIAYHLTLTLVETALLFLPAVAVGLLIPRRWAGRYLPLASVLLLEAALMAAGLQAAILFDVAVPLLLIVCLLLVVLTLAATPWIAKLGNGLRLVAERLSLLTWLYIVLDVFGLVIVVVRNL